MKRLLLILIFLSACSAQPHTPAKIKNPKIAEILAIGDMTELNNLSPDVEKVLGLKLYAVPSRAENDCFPESHGTCAYDYYLTTTQLDDSPVSEAYSLGTFGEITKVVWVSTDSGEEKAVLNFRVSAYSNLALEYNKTLVNTVSQYELIASPRDITFEKTRVVSQRNNAKDTALITQLTLDLNALNPYYHAETLPERSPLAVLAIDGFAPGTMPLEKFGRPVTYLEKDRQDLEGLAYIEFTNIMIDGSKASVDFRYDIEGITGHLTFEKNSDDEWRIVTSDLSEA